MQERSEKLASSLRAIRPRTIVVSALAVGGSLLLVAAANGLTPLLLVNNFVTFLQSTSYAPLLFMAADAVRPLLLIPDAISIVASGFIFGPVYGTLISLVGLSSSALVAYAVGRKVRTFSPPESIEERNDTQEQPEVDHNDRSLQAKARQLLAHYGDQMEKHPFASMLLMHAVLIPYDPINYVAGYLGLAWQPFLLGTLLGTAPSMITGVLTGSSLQSIALGSISHFSLVPLIASGLLLAGSVGIANYLHEGRHTQPTTDAVINVNASVEENEQPLHCG